MGKEVLAVEPCTEQRKEVERRRLSVEKEMEGMLSNGEGCEGGVAAREDGVQREESEEKRAPTTIVVLWLELGSSIEGQG